MEQPKILVIEDEEYLRDLYEEILKEENYYIETAKDGTEGIAKAKKGGWDLILLDIMLPGIDGIEIIKTLKNNPPPIPNRKIIFLTNLDKNKELEQALVLGDGCIIKSKITPDVLVEKIKTYLKVSTDAKDTSPTAGMAEDGITPAGTGGAPTPPNASTAS